MKPSRPPIHFPSYTQESSATCVDGQPWFEEATAVDTPAPTPTHGPTPARSPAVASSVAVPKPAGVAAKPQPTRASVAAGSPGRAPVVSTAAPARQHAKPPAASLPKARPTTSSRPIVQISSSPAPASMARVMPPPVAYVAQPVAPPPAMTKTAPLPAVMTDAHYPARPAAAPPPVPAAPEPERAAAPAWAIPALPKTSAPVAERRDLPSFGPVAFDLDGRELPTQLVRVDQELRDRRAKHRIVTATAAAMVALFAIVAGRSLTAAPSGEVSPAAAGGGVVTTSIERLPSAPPSIPSPPPSLASPRLTPEQLFPKAAPSKPAAPNNLSPSDYRRDKARLAADLAHRNAPVPPFAVKGPLGGQRPPSLDDVLRGERLRGERD